MLLLLFLDMKTVQYSRLNLIRVTIRPLFPGHVLFLDLQKCVRPGFLNRPNCPWFSYFLNPAPAEFLTIAVCSRNMFRCRDFRVHSFKRSNIEYNFGASGSHYLYAVYLNIFEWAFALFTFTFDFAITRTLCKGSTSYKIRYLSLSSGSVEQQILKHGLVSHLSLFSTCDQSNLTLAALDCQVRVFFHRIGLLLNCCHGLIFQSGLKVEILHKLHLTEMLVLKHFAFYLW